MAGFIFCIYYKGFTSRWTPLLIQLVQIFTLGPLGIRAHCKFGYFLLLPQGLNLVARTLLEYFPTTLVPFRHDGQIFDINLVYLR